MKRVSRQVTVIDLIYLSFTVVCILLTCYAACGQEPMRPVAHAYGGGPVAVSLPADLTVHTSLPAAESAFTDSLGSCKEPVDTMHVRRTMTKVIVYGANTLTIERDTSENQNWSGDPLSLLSGCKRTQGWYRWPDGKRGQIYLTPKNQAVCVVSIGPGRWVRRTIPAEAVTESF